jgi:hypothetical protein
LYGDIGGGQLRALLMDCQQPSQSWAYQNSLTYDFILSEGSLKHGLQETAAAVMVDGNVCQDTVIVLGLEICHGGLLAALLLMGRTLVL